MAKPAAVPKPKIVSQVCSVCGLDWELHGEEPTTETCVKLLLDEVAVANKALAASRNIYPPVIVQPYRTYYPQWYTQWGGLSSGGSITYGGAINATSSTSALSNVTNSIGKPSPVKL